jgi:flagellar motor switch protein FliM
MLDRLLGGTVDGAVMRRPTTDIELVVMQRVLEVVLDAWRDAWSQIQPMRPHVLGLETNPLFTQVASPSDIVLNVGMTCGLGRREGRLRMCLPFTMVEPVVQKLAARRWRAEVQERPGSRASALRQHLADVPVPLGVRLATVRLPLEQVLNLGPGALVPLHVRADTPALVEIRGAVKHTARVGQAQGHLAIQVLDQEGSAHHARR